ncbi:MAG: hypothetical protein IPJ30_07050 [Acidobacteria bacterium]|nr:hypothetical protein [Acidobacteriota bacterium]
MEKNKGFWILAIYLFLAVYLLPMFPHGGSADELTRWATAASLVEKSSFEISWTEELIGPSVETAKVGSATYSNKPPGMSMLAAPIYALTRAIVGPPNDSNLRISWFVMRFFFSTLPILLLGWWLYSRDTDEFSLAILLFASPLFVYSLLFFSHVFVGVLLYAAFRVIYDAPRIFLRNCFLAGSICGLAVISEFPALIPVAVLGGGLLFAPREDRFRNVFFFLAGSAPFAMILAAYNYSLYGSPFALSYAYESFPGLADGTGGVGVPSLSSLYLLLFSPARGLFFYAPILVLSVVAFVTSREYRTRRHRVKVAIIVVSVIALCGHGAAHGGWAFGARYLVMLLPLLLDSFFDGEIYEFSNLWQGFLFAISFVLCTVPILTFPFAPPEFRYPHNSFWGKFLWNENWFTPNLANVAGFPSSIWTILPAAIMLVAVFYIVWRYARRPARFFVGATVGLLVVAGYFLLPNLDSSEKQFRRAAIAESYFRPAGRLENFRGSMNSERLRDMEWSIAETRASAPDDFPYLETRGRTPSPTAELKRALSLEQAGNGLEAESALQKGKELFPFARCEFATSLSDIYLTTDRKDLALTELESIQELVTPSSRPECLRSQFLLATLYRENGQTGQADQMLQKFLANSANSNDPQIRSLRQQALAK